MSSEFHSHCRISCIVKHIVLFSCSYTAVASDHRSCQSPPPELCRRKSPLRRYVPVVVSCQYGQMTMRPRYDNVSRSVFCISVVLSSTPGSGNFIDRIWAVVFMTPNTGRATVATTERGATVTDRIKIDEYCHVISHRFPNPRLYMERLLKWMEIVGLNNMKPENVYIKKESVMPTLTLIQKVLALKL
ncbi:THAP-type domain-containing protein [Aphis craccivora]|uniref:THAP-type domain-containing protein n=1 Tax=Aphis craccivora TaxID=307492 RepID=A0A6G0VZ18_APHCR|nr:THAP-type domain-containing protein [Aphis craccivora]